MDKSLRRGQLILEALMAIGVAAIVVGLSAGIFTISLRGNKVSLERDIATGLLAETMDAVKAIGFEKWLNLSNPIDNTNTGTPNKGTGNLYFISQSDSSNAFLLASQAPSAAPNWQATSSSSPRNVWAVGSALSSKGQAWKWDGENWIDYSSDSGGVSYFGNVTMNGVSAVSLNEVWAVGDTASSNFKVFKFDGNGFVDEHGNLTSGAVNLNDVSAPGSTSSDKTRVWIVGDGGFVRFNSGLTTPSWSNKGYSGSANLFGVSGVVDAANNNADDALVVGASGTVKLYNGKDDAWTDHTPGAGVRWSTNTMRGASMISTKDLWVAGDGGNVWSYNGTTWTSRSSDTGASWGATNLKKITAFNDNYVIVTGASGNVWTWNGSTWSNLTPAAGTKWDSNTMRVSDRFSTDLWFVGDNVGGSQVWRYQPVKWTIGSCGGSTCTGTPPVDQVTENGVTYNRHFFIQNICRSTSANTIITGPTDSNGNDTACVGSTGSQDPSTLGVTATVTWAGGSVSSSDYVTRWANIACTQSSWNGSVVADPNDAKKNTNVSTCGTSNFSSITTDTTPQHNAQLAQSPNGNLAIGSAETKGGTFTSGVFDGTLLPYNQAQGGAFPIASRGVTLNSLIWNGSNSIGSGAVRIAVATSNCPNASTNDGTHSGDTGTCLPAGTWNFVNESGAAVGYDASNCNTPAGKCLLTSNFMTPDPGKFVKFNNSSFTNTRYFRFQFTLCRTAVCAVSVSAQPTFNSITINYSP